MLDERHRKILGEDFQPRFDPNLWTIRANTLKMPVQEMKARLESQGYKLEQIPWVEEGFWIRTEKILTKTEDYASGFFVSQDASSMIPPIVLDPRESENILDMSAAPGSKTTQIAAMLRNKGSIVANDSNYSRLKGLRSNLERCGAENVTIMNVKGETFWKEGLKFDKILLDAPCTGTGTLNPRILRETSESSIRRLRKLQKELVNSAFKSLREGGTIVYSTCSIEPEENEAVIDYAIKKLGALVQKIDIDIPKYFRMKSILEWGGEAFDESLSDALRIVPTEKTEGFFVCKLQRG
jgi:NOL1/NOP2/sun family putative RNA methylase